MKSTLFFVLLNVGFVSSLSVLAPKNETNVKCHQHAEFNQCGSSCPLTCEDVIKGKPAKVCTTLCKAECQCKKGYALKHGHCVKESHCKRRGIKLLDPSKLLSKKQDSDEKKEKCPKHAEFKKCSNICPATCGTKIACQSLQCGPPKCQCKPGYVLGGADNKECVKCKNIEKNGKEKQ